MEPQTSGPPERRKDFFVSYNRADRAWAEWIAWQLEGAGYTTVLQAWDFGAGSNFVLEMDRAAKEADRTIAVLSPAYLDARYPQPEWAAAFARDPTGQTRTLVPVRVRECNVEGLLGQIVYVDLVGHDEAAARDRLLAGVQRTRAKPTAAPVFPGAAPRSIPEPHRFPGALPPIWNVAHERNPNFTGREAGLAELRRLLVSGEPAGLTQAITGLGGVGKTQLAVEYAYRYGGEYEAVWWLRAEEPATLRADFAGLAKEAGIVLAGPADEAVVVEAVRAWLRARSNWLLVFDNAREPGDVRPYLPRPRAGHVVITSRSRAWAELARPLVVQVLPRGEAVAFLLRRTGQADGAAADELAAELGDLPLALEQAGAYIEATAQSLAGYLRLFRARTPEVLEWRAHEAGHTETVATTWGLALEKVREASPAAIELLTLNAFLAPDDIPISLIRGRSQELPERLAEAMEDDLTWDTAVRVLRRYSLIEVVGDALSVHRLVQTVVRNGLTGEEQRAWAAAAVWLLSARFSFLVEDIRTWPPSARLVPHGLTAAGHAEHLGVGLEAAAALLNRIGLYLGVRAQPAEARVVLERAAAIGERLYGPDHPEVARVLSNLANVQRELGDLARARANAERALAIADRAYGPDHPEVAWTVTKLGIVLAAEGDLAGARANLERALAIHERAFGSDHPEAAKARSNLSQLQRTVEELPAARANLERALGILERAFGPDHIAVAKTVAILGGVLQDLGDLQGARANLERALATNERALGPDDPEVIGVVITLGLVLWQLGDLPGARANLERAQAAYERAFGPDDPKVAAVVASLGAVSRAQGDLPRARAKFEQALAIDEHVYGSDHPDVATILASLGAVLRDLGDLQGARVSLERALAAHERAFGPDHIKVAGIVTDLALVLRAQGDLSGARGNLERALAINERTHGPDHPEVAGAVINLGLLLRDLGDLQEARTDLERGLAIEERAYGPEHAKLAGDLNNLATVLSALGDLPGAMANLERAMAIRERVLGPNHPDVAKVLTNLGLLQRMQGELVRAKANLERAQAINQRAFGRDHPDEVPIVAGLGLVLRDLGDLSGAKANLQRALSVADRVYGSYHPDVAKILVDLGRILSDLGDLPGARENLQRALAIREQAFGPEHPEVGEIVAELGIVLWALGELDGARANLQRALAISERAYDADHPCIGALREILLSIPAQ